MKGEEEGIVCVTGGTGYVASWLIMRLLERGYRVHTTIRSYPNTKKDISYLVSLPGASERLKIFSADLDSASSFRAAIEGCTGVFHVAHPIDFEDREPEEVKNRRAINGTLEILKACLSSETVKRVVYTSSTSASAFRGDCPEAVDEASWSDVEFIRSLKPIGASYYISKTLTERAALEFAEENGLDLVSVIPSYINGPFLTPHIPGSVNYLLSLITGNQNDYKLIQKIPMVHIDDVVSAHIFLLEHPDAKGRYVCSSVDITIEKISEFLSAKHPEYQIPSPDSLKEVGGFRYPDFSSKKLVDIGFKYKYGIEEMFNGAIRCCNEKGLL